MVHCGNAAQTGLSTVTIVIQHQCYRTVVELEKVRLGVTVDRSGCGAILN